MPAKSKEWDKLSTKKLCMTAVLSGLALIIFVVEAQLPPMWIPGIKLGLANVITLVALLFGGYAVGGLVLLIRVVLGSVFCGTFISFMFSMCGGAAAYIAMCISLHFLDKKQIWVASVFGACGHSIGQIVAAAFLIGVDNVFVLLPLLLIASVITGVFTGICAQKLWFSPLQRYKKI